jgi:hypothetical protein
MSFLPVLSGPGLTGWTYLKRTGDQQIEVYSRNSKVQRDETYFRENIAKVTSAQDLMADRRLLRVALEAFGLEEDMPNRAFIRQILEQGTLDPQALANKLADKRYLKLSAAFGFDLTPPRTRLSDFADKMVQSWKARGFERAVGVQDDRLRLGLNAQRELAEVANSSASENAKWFTVLGQPPLRAVFEGAFGLPKSFGVLPLDRQKDILIEKSKAMFGDGTVAQFTDPDRIEPLVRRFLLRSDAAASGFLPGGATTALTLLQAMTFRQV